MRTLKLTIAYDGTRYAGWQVQDRAAELTGDSPVFAGARSFPEEARAVRLTVQGTLERVLHRILQEPVRVIASGRTDAGVHALAQVAHVTTHSSRPVARLLGSVNQLLPPDIAVLRVDEVEPHFHARFQAVRKRYRYRIFTAGVVPPFIRPYVHHVRAPLNVARMRREAAALRGRHDFQAFARAGAGRPGASSRRGAAGATARGGAGRGTVRTITEARLMRRGEELHVELEGDGFLHTMARRIVGTLVDVGRGHLAPGTVRRMLDTGERRIGGPTAPACGLALVSVTYS
jgi:tRNA pseudouridine38-40 synthase